MTGEEVMAPKAGRYRWSIVALPFLATAIGANLTSPTIALSEAPTGSDWPEKPTER